MSAYVVTPWRLTKGVNAYLCPVAPGAPSESYRQPAVTVVSVALPLATVALPDGRHITTAARNVRETALPHTDPRPRTLPARHCSIDPRHGTELALFGDS